RRLSLRAGTQPLKVPAQSRAKNDGNPDHDWPKPGARPRYRNQLGPETCRPRLHGRISISRDTLHLVCKSIARARYGQDVAPLEGLTERLAKHKDSLSQIRLFHKPIRPDRPYECVLGHN